MKFSLIYGALILFALPSCSFYSERFTKYENNTPDHTVQVTHVSFMLVGKAARLTTETQTEEFIRSVNADGISVDPDNDAVGTLAGSLLKAIAAQ